MPSPDLHHQIATALQAALLTPPQSRDRAKAMDRLIDHQQQHPSLKTPPQLNSLKVHLTIPDRIGCLGYNISIC